MVKTIICYLFCITKTELIKFQSRIFENKSPQFEFKYETKSIENRFSEEILPGSMYRNLILFADSIFF